MVEIHVDRYTDLNYPETLIVEMRDQESGELYGHAVGIIHANLVYLDRVFVNQQHRRKGVGSAVLTRFLDEAKTLNVARVEGYFQPDDELQRESTLHFYQSHGMCLDAEGNIYVDFT